MKVLVVNAGSSSLKYQLLDMDTEEILAKGNAERIGLEKSFLRHKAKGVETVIDKELPNHEVAISLIIETLVNREIGVIKDIHEIDAFGHRVVHGGEKYRQACVVTPTVLADIKSMLDFAPLHVIPNASGIEGCLKAEPSIPNVLVFDTAFHGTMPDYAYLYALPYSFYRDYRVRRYGFHGTSHKHVGNLLAESINRPFNQCKLITCHLGNGSSITAIENGKCVDTSMGFTPLEGLIMGTRSGDIDPSIINFISKKKNLDVAKVTDILNKESGLMGISEVSSDMRDLMESIEKGNKQSALALKMMAYRVKKYIGSYISVMNGVDGIAFTAGIGEHTPELREEILKDMQFFGVEFDREANYSIPRGHSGRITKEGSRVQVYVIPTNEELEIARETVEVISRLRK